MKLQHGHTYRTRCGWVGKAEYNYPHFKLSGCNHVRWYDADGMYLGRGYDTGFPLHVIAEVTDLPDTARDSLIESLRGIAERWHEPLAKAHMIALLEIVDELKKELETA